MSLDQMDNDPIIQNELSSYDNTELRDADDSYDNDIGTTDKDGNKLLKGKDGGKKSKGFFTVKHVILIIIVLLLIGVLIWGGIKIYKKHKAKKNDS